MLAHFDRSKNLFSLALFFFVIIFSIPTQSQTQKSIEDKIKDKEIFLIQSTDSAMNKAYAKAKKRLPDFLKSAENPPKEWQTYAIKVNLKDEGGSEYIWIVNFKHRNGAFTGVLGNTPVYLTTYKADDTVTFKESDIVDWNYRQDLRIEM